MYNFKYQMPDQKKKKKKKTPIDRYLIIKFLTLITSYPLSALIATNG